MSSPGAGQCTGLDEVGGGGGLGMQIGNCDFWPEQGAGEMMGDTLPYRNWIGVVVTVDNRARLQ